MIRFIDEHQDRRSGTLRWGIEPIAKLLGIAPSTYHAARNRSPSARAVRDAELRPVIQRVLRAEDFFAHKRPLPRLSPAAYRADHVLTLIHEAINQKWHESHGYWAEDGRVKGSRRLIWSVDFDLLARALDAADWARLVELSGERGVSPLVAEALRGAAGDLRWFELAGSRLARRT